MDFTFTLSKPGAAHCAPSPKSRHIFKTAWNLEFLLCDFSFWKFSIQESLVLQTSSHVCCHGNHTDFGIILKTHISVIFQVFPPERNFLWDNLLCFENNNTLRSLNEANIRSVTVEKIQEIILPKYDHRHWANWLVICFTACNQHFTPQKSSDVFCDRFNSTVNF